MKQQVKVNVQPVQVVLCGTTRAEVFSGLVRDEPAWRTCAGKGEKHALGCTAALLQVSACFLVDGCARMRSGLA